MRIVLLILNTIAVLCSDPQRQDTEGLMLERILRKLAVSGSKIADQSKFIRSTAEKHLFPPDFMLAFFDVFSPHYLGSVSSLADSLGRLGKASIACAQRGFGICFSMLGFLTTVHPSAFEAGDLERVLQLVPADVSQQELSLDRMLYRTAMEYGSTLGTLGYFRRTQDPNSNRCRGILVDSLTSLAEESAAVDTASEWLGPSVVDFDSAQEPIGSLTVDSIRHASEGLGYLLSVMKENAEALVGSLIFDPFDTLIMMGLEESLSDDELRQSVEGIAGADEEQIAMELIEGIMAVRYNVNAARYNEGVVLIESGAACASGLVKLRDVAASQNVLIKSLFLMMKRNYFQFRDFGRAYIVSLLLSDVGILAGDLNAISLLDRLPAIAKPQVDKHSRFSLFQGLNISCAGPVLERFQSTEGACRSACSAHPDCNFAAYQQLVNECALFTQCVVGVDDRSARLFKTVSYAGTVPCDPTSVDPTGCREELHKRAALGHNHSDSVHWLIRHAEAKADIDLAFWWAQYSADLGHAEGQYYLAKFLRQGWLHRPSDVGKAREILWNLLLESPIDQAFQIPVDWTVEDEIEFETVQDIASQIGIKEDGLGNVHSPPHSFLPRRVAGITGLLLSFTEEYTYLIARLTTLAALLPILIYLISYRGALA